MEQHADLTAIALVMTVAVLCGLILTGLRQPAIVGYILAGVVLGPTGLGLIGDNESVRVLAELGVLMLLFIVGMELSLRAFKSIYRVALTCAALQIGLSLGATVLAGWLLGWPPARAPRSRSRFSRISASCARRWAGSPSAC
jgi:CPA2 family monovalent cation:H+ antiporter-2